MMQAGIIMMKKDGQMPKQKMKVYLYGYQDMHIE